MTTYSQSLTVYNNADIAPEGWTLLPTLYQLASKGDGSTITFTGTGVDASVSVTVPARVWNDAVDAAGPPSSAWLQRVNANRLFRNGRVVTITATDYDLYAHGSYFVERNKANWHGNPELFANPSNPFYVLEHFTPP